MRDAPSPHGERATTPRARIARLVAAPPAAMPRSISRCTTPPDCQLKPGPKAGLPADGLALALGDYAGTPLSHVTSLSYSTYRQSVDSSHVLAIALQFNVDFDLSDASNAWQGRIV